MRIRDKGDSAEFDEDHVATDVRQAKTDWYTQAGNQQLPASHIQRSASNETHPSNYAPLTATNAMITKIATNCRQTRQRMSF